MSPKDFFMLVRKSVVAGDNKYYTLTKQIYKISIL